jgi:hypothetical protein
MRKIRRLSYSLLTLALFLLSLVRQTAEALTSGIGRSAESTASSSIKIGPTVHQASAAQGASGAAGMYQSKSVSRPDLVRSLSCSCSCSCSCSACGCGCSSEGPCSSPE